MFTGLIKEVGQVTHIQKSQHGIDMIVRAPHLISQIAVDDSVAINGICLTATEIMNNSFKVQAVHVTLEKTSLSACQVGSHVNLELALLPTDRLGGHFVQGHVNGLGTIKKIDTKGDNYELWVDFPNELTAYFVAEGSIALDGISLTIARLKKQQLCVSIIPHTWSHTNLYQKDVGDIVNIEVDMLAKYVESLLQHQNKNKAIYKDTSIDQEWLRIRGYDH